MTSIKEEYVYRVLTNFSKKEDGISGSKRIGTAAEEFVAAPETKRIN